MMHSFPRTFSLPQDRRERVSAAAHAPLTPATYLRLRREAAGLKVEQVAACMARDARQIATAMDLVELLETPGNTARRPETLQRLRAVFPFDPDVYRQLAVEPPSRHPAVCRGCGCSHWDPCTGDTMACRLVGHGACTRCLDDSADSAAGDA